MSQDNIRITAYLTPEAREQLDELQKYWCKELNGVKISQGHVISLALKEHYESVQKRLEKQN